MPRVVVACLCLSLLSLGCSDDGGRQAGGADIDVGGRDAAADAVIDSSADTDRDSDGGIEDDGDGNGQNPATLLGSLLRIDVDGPAGDQAYAVPADNPFVGDPAGRDEVYAFGFRNPWRYAFDPCADRLLLADVGQHAAEEINLVRPAGNYGWVVLEGVECYDGSTSCARDSSTRARSWHSSDFTVCR